MNPRTPRGRAVLLLALWGLALATWAVTALGSGHDDHAETVTGQLVTTVVTYVPLVVIAALLVWRVPSHGVTRVLAVMAVCGAVGLFAAALLNRPTSSPGQWDLSRVLGGLAWLGNLPLLPVLFLLFPTGSPRSRRWRVVLYAQFAALAVLLVLVLADADLSGRVVQWLAVTAGVVLIAGGILAAVGLVLRWRRSAGEERAQLRVFALTAAAVAGFYTVGGVALVVGFDFGSPADVIVTPAIFLAPVLATGYTVARHHLYGIDPVVNRFAVWGLVTVVLLGVYVTAVALLAWASGAARGSPAVAAVVAVLVAICLAPVRSRVQRIVDRAMYGARDDPLEMLRAAGTRLSKAVEPADVGLEIVRAATGSLRLPWGALDLETEGHWTRVAEIGTPGSAEPRVVPIRDAGEDVGRLLAAPRPGERSLAERDARVLADLATLAAPAVRAARLVTELTASRERLVRARESERHRLRRDLHDSLSPALSGIGMSADTARKLLGSQPRIADGLLQRISAEARDTAEVVRRMLADLQPPLWRMPAWSPRWPIAPGSWRDPAISTSVCTPRSDWTP